MGTESEMLHPEYSRPPGSAKRVLAHFCCEIPPPSQADPSPLRKCVTAATITSRQKELDMHSGKLIVRAAVGLILGLASLFSTGCATDRQVISQAANVHSGLKPAVITDPTLAQYIQAVGDRVVTAAKQATEQGYGPSAKSEEDSAWMFSKQMQFHLVASDQLNAFTTGGEHMYIYSELFEGCRTEDELAAVVAHEYAHVYGRHVHKGMNRQYAMLGAAAAAGAAGYALGSEDNRLAYAGGFAGAALAAGQFVGMGYTRSDEREADDMGFDFYIRAGWDPYQFTGFFKQMIAKGHDKTPEMLSDHPSLASRVEAVETKINRLPPSATKFRRPPVAGPTEFKALQARSKQVAASMPKNDAVKGAGLLLASFPSCVAGVDSPEQQRAQKRVQAIAARAKQQAR